MDVCSLIDVPVFAHAWVQFSKKKGIHVGAFFEILEQHMGPKLQTIEI